jgi:hypothetical protein
MLAEMGITLDLVAAVVGHEAGGKETRTLVRHYVRTDLIERKVRVLRAWDERLQGIVAGREAEKVATAERVNGGPPAHKLDGAPPACV